MASLARRGVFLARRLSSRVTLEQHSWASNQCLPIEEVSRTTDQYSMVCGRRSIATYTENAAARELYNRHRQIIPLDHYVPDVAIDAWVAPNSTIIGKVIVQDRSTVWYGCVLRGDLNQIKLGSYSSIGDKTVVHAAPSSPNELSAETVIGRYVTIGPQCSLRSCTIEDGAVIGNRCVLLEGSLVEKNAVLGDGSVLPPGRLIPSGQLWAGNPATFVRTLTGDEIASIKILAESIYKQSLEHFQEFLPYSTAYIEVETLRKSLTEVPPPAANSS